MNEMFVKPMINFFLDYRSICNAKKKTLIEFFLFLECGKCLAGNTAGSCGVMATDPRDPHPEGGPAATVDRHTGCLPGSPRLVETISGSGQLGAVFFSFTGEMVYPS